MNIDPALRAFVSALSDSSWSSSKARAEGMRKIAIAQRGSLGQIDSIKFAQRLAEQTIRRLLPPLLRQIGLNDAADRCEQEGTEEAAASAASAALAAADAAASTAINAALAATYAADAARFAANATRYAALAATYAADAARFAAYAARYASRCATNAAAATNAARDGVLTFMCDICIDILREMKAPGIALMDQVC